MILDEFLAQSSIEGVRDGRQPSIDVSEFLDKQMETASPDLLREMVRTFAEAMMALMPTACATHHDAYVLVVPLIDTSRGLVDAAFLAALPDGGVLVNAARGARHRAVSVSVAQQVEFVRSW